MWYPSIHKHMRQHILTRTCANTYTHAHARLLTGCCRVVCQGQQCTLFFNSHTYKTRTHANTLTRTKYAHMRINKCTLAVLLLQGGAKAGSAQEQQEQQEAASGLLAEWSRLLGVQVTVPSLVLLRGPGTAAEVCVCVCVCVCAWMCKILCVRTCVCTCVWL